MREIGSEFWPPVETDTSVQNWWTYAGADRRFFASGRTALTAVLADIAVLLGRELRSAALPSYCCDSMLAPFAARGIEISFYSVRLTQEGLQIVDLPGANCEAILCMEYFGFSDEKVSSLIEKESARGKIVIQDATHSLLQKKPFHEKADYVIASLRKWAALSGAGVAIKRNGLFCSPPPNETFAEFVALRSAAAALKRDYIGGNNANKGAFLSRFAMAEELLEHSFADYAADDVSEYTAQFLDASFQREKRRENAVRLLQGLSGRGGLALPFGKVREADAPLFVPLLIAPEKRSLLRAFLTEQKIYCPVHWPLSPLHRIGEEDLATYASELSIPCDQRYSESDMLRVIEVINSYFEVNA